MFTLYDFNVRAHFGHQPITGEAEYHLDSQEVFQYTLVCGQYQVDLVRVDKNFPETCATLRAHLGHKLALSEKQLVCVDEARQVLAQVLI